MGHYEDNYSDLNNLANVDLQVVLQVCLDFMFLNQEEKRKLQKSPKKQTNLNWNLQLKNHYWDIGGAILRDEAGIKLLPMLIRSLLYENPIYLEFQSMFYFFLSYLFIF